MCDSIRLYAMLDDMTEQGYQQCNYPAKGKEDTNVTSSDFRDQYTTSPLTGAGFKITPIGIAIQGGNEPFSCIEKRLRHGRITGYLVELNAPACLVGHNRELVNGVPLAAIAGLALLKYWLASNGCTKTGVDSIKADSVILDSVTPTFLFPFSSEDEARLQLAHVRSRSEALLNKKSNAGKTDKKVAYSYPAAPPIGATTYIYTSYIRQRGFLIDAYVKVAGVSKAFCTPIVDSGIEWDVQKRAERTLRIGVKLHGKWLRDNGLDKISAWLKNPDAYKKAFDLIREILRLDEPLRSKQLRMPSLKSLNLSKLDKTLLSYHLKGNIVNEHPHFRTLSEHQIKKAYSASKIRVYKRTGIDFGLRYDEQIKQLHPLLSDLLVFPGEYEPDEKCTPFVYSRISVPAAIHRLEELIASALQDPGNR